MPYPKRIIEVDLPIRRISTHARREKSIRHGHISTLHIWWARRPLAACRAVLCAALYPDPADPLCPADFIETAQKEMQAWANDRLKKLSLESRQHFNRYRNDPSLLSSLVELRHALLDFIADFANWDNSTDEDYLNTARTLTQAAHEALGGEAGSRPLVVDPFAGGGSIPLEALRVGADAFASDLNPIPVLINKVQLEYIPRYGKKLAGEVRKWGKWIKGKAEDELMEFYPEDKHSGRPIAYLWARTVRCEGPNCAAEIPLLRSLVLIKKGEKSVILDIVPNLNNKDIDWEILENIDWQKAKQGTVNGGAACCPFCEFVTNPKRVKSQLQKQRGGANHSKLICIYVEKENGRKFRLPNAKDFSAIELASKKFESLLAKNSDLVPDELINPIRPYKNSRGISAVSRIGCETFGDLFNTRQLLSISTIFNIIQKLENELKEHEPGLATALKTVFALIANRGVYQNNSLARWEGTRATIKGAFSKQALAIVWDYAEANPFSGGSGDWDSSVEWILKYIDGNCIASAEGVAIKSSATDKFLPPETADILFTDPPYFAAIPYGDLSDFFYVWLRRYLSATFPSYFTSNLVDKDKELIVTNAQLSSEGNPKDEEYFRQGMKTSLINARETIKATGIGVIVYAEASSSGWEAMLGAIIDAGWMITSSWAIDTEMENRTQAHQSASLQSSIHIVCRPREKEDGTLITDSVGDWREVLRELPKRIHEWMPRLAADGVVGADAIFACLGPALEIFSRYSSVEKPNGEQVTLREYLEQVWAAVSQEALGMVFQDADVRGFEEDARLTAMWLWTLNQGDGSQDNIVLEEEDDEDEERNGTSKAPKLKGFALEYDTARKISQGLGVRLESLGTLVHYKGDKARLLPVEERMSDLFGIEKAKQPVVKKRQSKEPTPTLFDTLPEWQEPKAVEFPEPKLNGAVKTTLDRLHTAMLLFGTGRTDALKRFLVESGAGSDERFWKLAQALNALYPKNTDERRWVEAVQTYKKSLGF